MNEGTRSPCRGIKMQIEQPYIIAATIERKRPYYRHRIIYFCHYRKNSIFFLKININIRFLFKKILICFALNEVFTQRIIYFSGFLNML